MANADEKDSGDAEASRLFAKTLKDFLDTGLEYAFDFLAVRDFSVRQIGSIKEGGEEARTP